MGDLPFIELLDFAVDRIGWIDRVVLGLIGIDQGRQHIEPVAFGRSRPGALFSTF